MKSIAENSLVILLYKIYGTKQIVEAKPTQYILTYN